MAAPDRRASTFLEETAVNRHEYARFRNNDETQSLGTRDD